MWKKVSESEKCCCSRIYPVVADKCTKSCLPKTKQVQTRLPSRSPSSSQHLPLVFINLFFASAFSVASVAQSKPVPPAGKPSILCSSLLLLPFTSTRLCLFSVNICRGKRPPILLFSLLLHSSEYLSSASAAYFPRSHPPPVEKQSCCFSCSILVVNSILLLIWDYIIGMCFWDRGSSCKMTCDFIKCFKI